MEESRQRRFGAVLSYISIFVTTLIQLLYTPLLITNLGQSEYGLYSLVYSIIGYLTILDLGFGNALVVYSNKYRSNKEYDKEKKLFGMFKIVFYIIGFIVALLGLLLYFNVENIFGNTMTYIELDKIRIMMLILILNLIITFIFNIYSSIIIAYEKFVFQKIISILNTILKPLIMIPLLFLGYKSITMCVVITLVNIFVIISNYLYCMFKLNIKVRFLGFDKEMFKIILKYSFFIFLGVIADKINWNVDQVVLGAVSGTIAVSVYAIASHINTLFVNLSIAISSVLLPKISKMVAHNASNDKLTAEFIKVGRIQYFLIFLMASGFILFGKEFIITWVGKEFTNSYYIAVILIVPLCVPLIQNLGISIMQAKNMHKFRSLLLFFISLANILISIPLAKLYGGIGSAIGTSVSLIIGNIIIINIYYHLRVGINVFRFWKEIINMTIPFAIPIIIILIIMNYITLYGYVNLLVFGLIYTFIYMFVCYFFVMNDYEKNIVNKIFIRLKRDNYE